MKKILSIYKVVLICILAVACESILEENPPSSISLSNFYQSESDALAGLNGAYRNMYDVTGYNYLLYAEMNADDMVISPIVSDNFAWDEFTYNSDVTGPLWSSCFSGINRANEVILYTDRIDFNAERKAEIITEAKALRAFYYFQLVRAIGGVPLYEEPTVGFDAIYDSRASEDEVYTLIISDLTEAVNILPATSPAGRFNADIANALLARVYLYRGDFANALTHARNVINSGRYALFSDYADIFRPENDNGTEHIFQVQYMSGEQDNIVPGRFGPRMPAGPYANAFWANTVVPGNCAPSAEFIAENPDSYRKTQTISDQFEHIDGVTGTVFMDDIFGGNFQYYISKFDDRKAESQSGLNFTLIRYADILLIAAEALNETDPSNNEKYSWINQIRERARNGVTTDLPDLEGLSQDQFRTAVLEERRFELAFEGQRAWDLKRRDMFLETLRAQGKSVADDMLLFPVPDEQVKLNKNLEQNPGW